MDGLKQIMPAIAVLTIIVCVGLKRKGIKEMFSTRPVLSFTLLFVGIAAVLVCGYFTSRFFIKM